MKKFISDLKIATSLFGKELTEPAIMMMVSVLSGYEENELCDSLKKCILKNKFFPTVADIISNLSSGHPNVEEAWALVPKTNDETAAMTQVMRRAFGSCYGLLEEDLIAARMVFKEVYEKELMNALVGGEKPKWEITLGHDKSKRITALQDAVVKKRIAIEYARSFVHDLPDPGKPHIAISESMKQFLPKMKEMPK